MARTSNSAAASGGRAVRRAIVLAAVTALAVLATGRLAVACPFCTVLAPSLSQLREQAAVVVLAEVARTAADKRSTVRLHKITKGAERIGNKETLDVTLDLAAEPGALVILFGTPDVAAPGSGLTWHAVGVNETSYAYFARAPSTKIPAAERLRYFGPYLEHRDALVAEDAYLEFGHAPFDEVAQVAGVLPLERLREWLVDPRVPQTRKGFYGLAIGLRATGDKRGATADFLRGLVVAPEDDFRAGFDGILGGYLLLAGRPGLDLIESRYLANPHAADGDVRHAMTALRFYHEYGREIPAARLGQSLARLLARSEFSEAVITDLARWKYWDALPRVAAVYEQGTGDERSRRAVVGYLLACPDAKAQAALAHLREVDPAGVAAAEQVLSKTSSVPASGE